MAVTCSGHSMEWQATRLHCCSSVHTDGRTLRLCLMSSSPPTSSHDTFGTSRATSRIALGRTRVSATAKSAAVTGSGCLLPFVGTSDDAAGAFHRLYQSHADMPFAS